MHPISPVIEGHQDAEIVYAKDQPQYHPLPALPLSPDRIVTRWQLSWRECLRLLFTRSVYLQVMTFGGPLQPVILSVDVPEVE